MNEGLTTCGRPSRGRYVQGCRCYMCRVANAEYSLEQSHRRDGGRMPKDTPMIGEHGVRRCRAHVLELLAHGWTKRGICTTSGVGRSALATLLDGRHPNARRCRDGKPALPKRMSRANYSALMALEVGRPHIAGGQLVDARPVEEAIRWLVAHGMSVARIARESGISYPTVCTLRDKRGGRCSQATAAKLARAARRLRRECERSDAYERGRR